MRFPERVATALEHRASGLLGRAFKPGEARPWGSWGRLARRLFPELRADSGYASGMDSISRRPRYG
jgi:hypothetical protein